MKTYKGVKVQLHLFLTPTYLEVSDSFIFTILGLDALEEKNFLHAVHRNAYFRQSRG
jgi:hypothetical protein